MTMSRVFDLGNTSIYVKVIIAINADGGGIILTVLSFLFLLIFKENSDEFSSCKSFGLFHRDL